MLDPLPLPRLVIGPQFVVLASLYDLCVSGVGVCSSCLGHQIGLQYIYGFIKGNSPEFSTTHPSLREDNANVIFIGNSI